jgi:hypothetical protein
VVGPKILHHFLVGNSGAAHNISVSISLRRAHKNDNDNGSPQGAPFDEI